MKLPPITSDKGCSETNTIYVATLKAQSIMQKDTAWKY